MKQRRIHRKPPRRVSPVSIGSIGRRTGRPRKKTAGTKRSFGRRPLRPETRRPLGLLVLLLVGGGLLFGCYLYMQLVVGRDYDALARSMHQDTIPLAGRRGRIMDRRGRLLTVNCSSCSVLIWPADIKRLDRTDSAVIRGRRTPRVERVAGLLERFGLGSAKDVRREIQRREGFYCHRHGVDYMLGDSLHQALVRSQVHDYTVVRDEQRRRYPYGEVCANVVGYVKNGLRPKGRAGIELRLDSLLAGRPGKAFVQKDRIGHRLPDPTYPRCEPEPGADVVLTLDMDVQAICYRALRRKVRESGAVRGSAVVLNASTGAVLALADYPGYDPEHYGRYPLSRHRSAAACDQFEPGSSFKIAIAAAALESDRSATLTRRSYDVSAGFVQIGDRKIHDVHRLDVLDFDGLLVQSSNPGCAMLSREVDSVLFYRTARALGFGYSVGLGLPGEASGQLDRPSRLTPVRYANIAFGQGVAVSLVQLAGAYQCIAAGGEYLRPYLVEAVVREGDTIYRFGRTEVRRALRLATAERLRWILARVVTEGTGVLARLPGTTAAGKTGTAQKIDPLTRRYSDTKTMMSFAGFFPAGVPRYVIAVTIDEPAVGRFASTVACPVFSEIGTGLLAMDRMVRRSGDAWCAAALEGTEVSLHGGADR